MAISDIHIRFLRNKANIMRQHRKYKITVEDETHLCEVASYRFSRPGLLAAAAGLCVASVVCAGAVISLTPLRALLPGYLKEYQRSATEEGLLRLDSLMEAFEVNNSYIENYLRVTDTGRVPADSASVTPVSGEQSSDSLLSASVAEQLFISQMEERERFNISVLAPLAADGIIFSPVTADGIFTSDSRTNEEGEIIMPVDESIQCAADGSVIALYHSIPDHGYVIVVQHPRGFASSYVGVGSPLVGIGDNVNSGQIIALAPSPDSRGTRRLRVRMWHNGLAIVPYEYLGPPQRDNNDESETFEAPRGRL